MKLQLPGPHHPSVFPATAVLPEAAPWSPSAADVSGAVTVSAPALGLDGTVVGIPYAVHAHLPEQDADSIPQGASFWTGLWVAVRTTAPFVVADLVALALAGLAAQAVVSLTYPAAAGVPGWRLASLCLLPMVLGYAMAGLYSEVWTHVVIELRHLSYVTTLWFLAAATGALPSWPLPVWCAAAWPAVLVLVPLLRTATHAVCQSRPWWGYPTLVIGSGDGAEAVVRALLAVPRSGLRPALLTDPSGTRTSSVIPVVNDRPTLESVVRAEAIRHAVVSLPDVTDRGLGEALDRYRGLVPHLLMLSNCSTLPTLWSAARNGGSLSGIEVRNALLMSTLQAVKRGIDVTVAGTALVAGAPLLMLVALLVKLTGRGPVLYGHKRVGRRGRLFRAWKFRTMRVDGDAILLRYLERNPAARLEWEREQKLRYDPRVTRVGAVLRRTSLDELPQLWNVLRGEMSLVGPRPIVAGEIWRYAGSFRLYAMVKPGITGLWQVSGRNEIGYDERVHLDEFYIRYWSLWLDAYIVAKTVVALLSRRGAR